MGVEKHEYYLEKNTPLVYPASRCLHTLDM